MSARLMERYSAREQLCKLHERIAESDDPQEMSLYTQQEALALKARIAELEGTLMDGPEIEGRDDHERI